MYIIHRKYPKSLSRSVILMKLCSAIKAEHLYTGHCNSKQCGVREGPLPQSFTDSCTV